MRSRGSLEGGGTALWAVVLLAVLAGAAVAYPLVMAGRTQGRAAREAVGQIDAANDALAQARLNQAMRAAQFHFAEQGTFAGFDPQVAAGFDPSVRYDTATTASPGVVSIRAGTATTVVLVTAASEDAALCTAADLDRITTGRADAQRPADCTGGW